MFDEIHVIDYTVYRLHIIDLIGVDNGVFVY